MTVVGVCMMLLLIDAYCEPSLQTSSADTRVAYYRLSASTRPYAYKWSLPDSMMCHLVSTVSRHPTDSNACIGRYDATLHICVGQGSKTD